MDKQRSSRRDILKHGGAGLGTASILGLAGCLGGGDDDGASGDLTEVTLINTDESMSTAILVGAESEGTFEEAGIGLDQVMAGYGRTATSLQNETDLSSTNAAMYMNYWRDDHEVVSFGPREEIVNRAFVPNDSDIEGPADFEGQTIGLPYEDSGTTMLMSSMIEQEWEYELEEIAEDIVYAGPATLWNLMNEQGDIDVMFQFTAATIQGLADESPVRGVFDPNEFWKEQTGNPALITAWTANRDWLEDNPQTALDFLQGWENTREYVQENTAEFVESYAALAGFGSDAEREVFEDVLEQGALPPMEDWDDGMVDAQQNIFEAIVENGFYESAPSTEEGFITLGELEDMA